MNKKLLSLIFVFIASAALFADITDTEHTAMWHPEKHNSNGYSTTAEVEYHLHVLGSEVHSALTSELHFLTRTQLYHLDGKDISTYPLPMDIKEDLSKVNSYTLEADVMDASYAFGIARFTFVSSTQDIRRTSERLSRYSGISEEELLRVYKTGNLRLTNFRIIEIDFAVTYVNRLRQYLLAKERDTQKLEEAKTDISEGRYDEAISKLNQVKRNSDEFSDEAETLLAEALSKKKETQESERLAREEEQERMINESSATQSNRKSSPSSIASQAPPQPPRGHCPLRLIRTKPANHPE